MTDSLFSDHIPLLRPWLGDEEAEAVREVIKSGWVSCGPKVAEFEERVAQFVGAKHAVATNAATTALHLAMQTSGLQRGDEVIVQALTCMADANAITIAGGVVRFADIERDTLNLDAADVEQRITPRTRAILMIDQVGLPADLDALSAVAQKHDLLLIDDAATALGGQYRGRYLGGHGVPTCFSFHPRKMITTGEGGMFVTDDASQAERARCLRSAGASVSDLVRHQAKGALVQQYFEPGYNYRMTDIQAAIGLVQMGRLPAMLAQRSAQAQLYDQLLADIEEVRSPPVPDYAVHAYSSYCIRLTAAAKVSMQEVVQRMAERQVSTRQGIVPLHFEPVFREQMPDLRLPQTEAAAQEMIFLPIFPGLREEQQRRVAQALEESLRS